MFFPFVSDLIRLMPTRTTWTPWRSPTARPSCFSLAAMMHCARCGTDERCGRTDHSPSDSWPATETASPSSTARWGKRCWWFVNLSVTKCFDCWNVGNQYSNLPLICFSYIFSHAVTLPGWCTVSDQQFEGSVHQALGHQEVFTQRGAGGFPPGCHPAKLGLPLATGSPERWGETRQISTSTCFFSFGSVVFIPILDLLCLSALKKHKLTGDTSVMTYRGHGVLHTLIRCRFSPEFSTGQRFIYSGCSTGKIISECHLVNVSARLPVFQLQFSQQPNCTHTALIELFVCVQFTTFWRAAWSPDCPAMMPVWGTSVGTRTRTTSSAALWVLMWNIQQLKCIC